MADKAQFQAEVDSNYAAFRKLSFPESAKGKFALLKHGKVVEIMDSKMDSHKLAQHIFGDDVYSIQEIGAKPVEIWNASDLGPCPS